MDTWLYFAAGVAVIPALVLAYYLATFAWQGIHAFYNAWRPWKETTQVGRVRVASYVMSSPVVFCLRLPGGMCMVWRSITSNAARQDSFDLQQAIYDAYSKRKEGE